MDNADWHEEIYLKKGVMNCPDTNHIEILNNPFLADVGANINMVVNFCDVAATAFNESSAHCLTDPDNRDVVWNYLHQKVLIQNRFITKFFNPEIYLENNNKMEWVGSNRMT